MLQRGENLSTLAYRKIEEMILEGALKPGDRFNEHRFAEANGLSRGPVREAVRALERDGLLTAVQAKGVYVPVVSEKHLDEVYDLRAMLTGLMCREAAGRATEQDCRDLRALNSRMRMASTAGDQSSYYATNLQFHDRIATIAENATAKRIYDGLLKETHSHRIAAASRDESIGEHDGIVDALEAKDGEKARRIGEEHVLAGKKRWHERRDAAFASSEREEEA